jgi:hypothetical protein
VRTALRILTVFLVLALLPAASPAAQGLDAIEDGAVGYHGTLRLRFTDTWGAWSDARDSGCTGTTHFDLIPEGDAWRLHFVAAAHCAESCPRDLMDSALEVRWRELQAERRLTGTPQGHLLPPGASLVCQTELTEHAHGVVLRGDPESGFGTGDTYWPWGEIRIEDGRLLYSGWHLFYNEYYVWDAQIAPAGEVIAPHERD